MKIRFITLASALIVFSGNVYASDDFSVSYNGTDKSAIYTDQSFREALRLYEKGRYAEAGRLFASLPASNLEAEAYRILCDVRMKKLGYETSLEEYVYAYPYSGMVNELRFRHAMNLFESENYRAAAKVLNLVKLKELPKDIRPEYIFKKAYCAFDSGSFDEALEGFAEVDKMPLNDFSAPSRYSTGYILYQREKFSDALEWFSLSARDPRFRDISEYYLMECHFMLKDYDYVTENAAKVFASVPESRRSHLARMISESYLVKGDTENAKQYYDRIGIGKDQSREDRFFAGSLLYSLKDYQGAVDNYSKMGYMTDSLGQIANYQMGYSYIKTKNKVAAMEAFKDAAMQSFNPLIQEDAYFNNAKLAFDLNNDPSVFDNYIKKFPNAGRGEQIYAYMALAALYNRDYAAAVAAYDNIDVLDKDMKNNYMKANYLRAHQLIENGSYRAAVPYLKAAAYYSDKYSTLNQLSRYWLAESYYRDENFRDAGSLFTDLYNLSALDGKKEGKLIPYNIAYSYFKQGNYESSLKWFDNYISSGDMMRRKDAFTRKGDAFFASRNYTEAVNAYNSAVDVDKSADDVYPYYQAGIAYGLANDQRGKIRSLSRVLEADPSSAYYPDAMYELGRSYLNSSADTDAEKCFKSMLKNVRDSNYIALAKIGLGMIERNRSQYDDALGYYKSVVESMPASEYAADALLAIESIYQTKQAPEEYLSYVESLKSSPLKSESDKEDMLFNAGEQIFLAENWQKAVTVLQSYQSRYPQGKFLQKSDFYIAESYKNLGRKELACDFYKKVILAGEGSFAEVSALNFATLSYGMEKYSDAFEGYRTLRTIARLDNNKKTAAVGLMRSAYMGKDYPNAILYAGKVITDDYADADEKRECDYILAKSYLATSRRKEAFALLKSLSAKPKTPEGAEAAYLLIQDNYDQGKFDAVEEGVYAFSDSATDQTYWLAKSFILLGDSFAERGEFAQARATFESIRDGYKSKSGEDEVLDNVNMRLSRLKEMNK